MAKQTIRSDSEAAASPGLLQTVKASDAPLDWWITYEDTTGFISSIRCKNETTKVVTMDISFEGTLRFSQSFAPGADITYSIPQNGPNAVNLWDNSYTVSTRG